MCPWPCQHGLKSYCDSEMLCKPWAPSLCYIHVMLSLLCATRGSLLTRSLADIVKKEDFVLDSEYLITLLVVVPKWVLFLWYSSKYCKHVWTQMIELESCGSIIQEKRSIRCYLTISTSSFCCFRIAYNDWHKTYETLAEMVVPRSSQ